MFKQQQDSSYLLFFTLLMIISLPYTSIEIVQSNDLSVKDYQIVDKIKFLNLILKLTGGLEKASNQNLIHKIELNSGVLQDYKIHDSPNTGFITRFEVDNFEDLEKWDERIRIASLFEISEELKQRKPHARMIANKLDRALAVFKNGSDCEYIVATEHLEAHISLKEMLLTDPNFVDYMSSPLNRISFYLELIHIFKVLIKNLKLKICLCSPESITILPIQKDMSIIYKPLFKHPEFAVPLNAYCDDIYPNFTSKSLIVHDLEKTSAYQATIEVFSLGRIIYFIEVIMGYHLYERKTGSKPLLDSFTQNELTIFNDRKKEKYDNASLFAANKSYRESLANYRSTKPYFESDFKEENEAIEVAMNKMFDLVDSMQIENVVINGRPNISNIESKMLEIYNGLEPHFANKQKILI